MPNSAVLCICSTQKSEAPNFFDTASGYSDSEEKIGYSLSDLRDRVYIATKCSGTRDRREVIEKIEQSLQRMKTDHVDVLQLHNPQTLPDPDDPETPPTPGCSKRETAA